MGMIVSGYRGELVIQGDLTTRWTHWFVSMCFFSYVVYTLLIGLADATNAEGPKGEGDAEERAVGDLHQLVHLPDRVPLPHAWHPRRPRGGRNSGWLLRLGRYLEVPGWPDDLPDHHLQVSERREERTPLRRTIAERRVCISV